MTLPPSDTWQERGVAGPSYKVGPICANPTCTHNLKGGRALTQSPHHMWRRSREGKPFDWIELPNGLVVGNVVGLCVRCHDAVTGRVGGYTAAIRLAPDNVFWWCSTSSDETSSVEYEFIAPLDPQPPTHEAHVASPADIGSENSCPTCGQPRARRRSTKPSGRRRVRKTWPVKVPADTEENGAEVLDSLTEDLAPLLGVSPDDNGTYTSGRYWVLVPALFYAQQNREDFAKSILGVS